MRKWLRAWWPMVLVLLFLTTVTAYVLARGSEQHEECARRLCPEGMVPTIVQYQGCVCVVRAR